MNPGSNARPAKSTTSVLAAWCFAISLLEPTARIFPSLIATASALGIASLTVTMLPPRMILSATWPYDGAVQMIASAIQIPIRVTRVTSVKALPIWFQCEVAVLQAHRKFMNR